MKYSIRSFGSWITVLVIAGTALLLPNARAATFLYTPTSSASSATDEWEGGEGWDSEPVSAADTTLVFGTLPPTAPPTFFTASDIVIDSVNNLPAGDLDANGRFQLNNLTAAFKGLIFNTAPAVAPQVNISGGALQFLADGLTNPVMALQANAQSTGTVGQKVILTIANDIYVGAPEFTITSDTNFNGGNSGGNVRLTGSFNFSDTGLHTLNFGGTGNAGTNLGGRAVFAGNIGDSGVGAGNATTLMKSGTSFWDLTGAVTHTGGTFITQGTIRATQATGLGTGDIFVTDGGQVYLSGGGTYANNFFLAGTGPSTSLGTVGAFSGALQLASGTTTGLITLLGDTRISSTNGSSTGVAATVTLASRITGGFAMTFGNGAGVNQGPMIISNPLNDYTGGTTFIGENRALGGANSGAVQTFIIGANEVLPHGLGIGDVVMSNGDQAAQTLNLNGFNETINGLNSAGNGSNIRRVIRNNAAGTTSLLTVGANDANGSFLGSMMDGSATAILSLRKVGAGTQTLTGTSTHSGDTRVSDGKLEIDYNFFATSQTSTPSNYFSTSSNLVLDGGTFAISGRRDGAASTQAGTGNTNQRVLTGIDTTNLAVGQLVDGAGSSGIAAGAYILRIESPTSLSLSVNTTTANATIATTTTSGTTSQAISGLTLSGAVGTTSTIDFGTFGSVALTFNSAPIQTFDGSLLAIDNWSIGDQLIFLGTSTDFTSVFDQSEVSFVGYGTGYSIIDLVDSYEVIAVPEPSALALLALGSLGLLTRHRRRR